MDDRYICVKANIRLLSTAEGGRASAITGSYRPNHNFFGPDSRQMTIGFIELPAGFELHPGEAMDLPVTLRNWPGLEGQIHQGRQWRIQEGGKLVGIGTVREFGPPSEDGGIMITLVKADPGHLPAFKRELQDAFATAVIETFGPLTDGPIPSDEDIEESFAEPGAVILEILRDGRRIGGAVVTIDEESQENELGFFFISAGEEGRGLGLAAWRAIEAMFPETRVWVTHTPYFEKRNIHFYLNKCGFRIVEFYHAHHRDPDMPGLGEVPGGDEMFRFEKVMPAR